jgi:DNA polymerase (family 10)
MTLHIDDTPFLPAVTPCDVPEIGEVARERACARAESTVHSPQSTVQRLPLARARKIAETVAERLMPFANRIEIAGSIRRGRETCGDIDLVIETRDREGLIDRVKQSCTLKTEGQQNTIAIMRDGTQIDLFFARGKTADLFSVSPSNWGTILLCRTGSPAHNIYMVEKAKGMGLIWNPYRGVVKGGSLTGEVIASETEEDIFRALEMEFVRPADREK